MKNFIVIYRKNCDSYDTIPYGPLCIEAVTCRRPPRARTEIALQADVLCGLSTCRCSPRFSRDPASFSEQRSSREEAPRDFRDCDNGKKKSYKIDRISDNFFFNVRRELSRLKINYKIYKIERERDYLSSSRSEERKGKRKKEKKEREPLTTAHNRLDCSVKKV